MATRSPRRCRPDTRVRITNRLAVRPRTPKAENTRPAEMLRPRGPINRIVDNPTDDRDQQYAAGHAKDHLLADEADDRPIEPLRGEQRDTGERHEGNQPA